MKRLMSSLLLACLALAVPSAQSSPFTPLGSFKAPAGFEYVGSGLTFRPDTNSLYFASGLNTSEISIPALGGTSSLRQGFTDAFAGKSGQIGNAEGNGYRVGGQVVYNGTLYINGFAYYAQPGSEVASFFSRPLTLSGGSVTNAQRIGSSVPVTYTSGYLGLVPAEHQAALGGPIVAGNCCTSIISRTSYGPALSSLNPANPGAAQPLVYYDGAHQALGNYNDRTKPNPQFNGSTRITGVVIPVGGDSVYFFGSTGTGTACYGTVQECPDPSNPYHGEHAYPYRSAYWAYRVSDLAKVRSGQLAPWQALPYAFGELPGVGDVTYDYGTGGAAYDPATQRVYLAERDGWSDGTTPEIHVFQLNLSAPPPVDPPTTTLKVTPASLTFVAVQGQTPATQTVTVSGCSNWTSADSFTPITISMQAGQDGAVQPVAASAWWATAPVGSVTGVVTYTCGTQTKAVPVTATVTTAADTTAPTVSVTSPAANSTVLGIVSVTATASDNVGVAGVSFTLDGAALGAEDTTVPYAASWPTLGGPDGPHVLRAVARDTAGNTATSAAASVTVNNAPPPVPTLSVPAVVVPGTGRCTGRIYSLGVAPTTQTGWRAQLMSGSSTLGSSDSTAPYLSSSVTVTSGQVIFTRWTRSGTAAVDGPSVPVQCP